jgi:hypothetical protein
MHRRVWFRSVPALAFVLAAGTADARGWVEKTVTSDSVTIDVERDGTAVVAHEIMFGIRGGPLPELSVGPIDADAEVQDDATATLARSGSAAGFPIPLGATVDGTRLALKVQVGKGLRSGTYLVRFRYKTNLWNGERIQSTESGTLVAWSGPSFGDGIDSARVVFRFPESPRPPRAPSQSGDASNIADDSNGVFLSLVRRGVAKDEFEVVRPHLAKGEVVSWRALVDPSTFDPVEKPVAAEPQAAPPPKMVTPPKAPMASRRASTWFALGLLSVVYGIVGALKSRWTRRAAEERRAVQKPLVPLPMAVRSTLASVALFGAGAAVLETFSPIAATACLVLALALCTHLPARMSPPLRGPGEWIDIGADALPDDPAGRKLEGRILDAATPMGFVVFAIGLGGFVAASIATLGFSPYYGVAIGLGSSILFPIFCTGRPTELPASLATLPAELVDWLLSELGKDQDLLLGAVGRVPRGATAPDELRLRVMPKKPLPGLRAIEVGIDLHQGPLGVFPLPFVIVRTLDGSSAADALPKGVYVTRGRGVDERVAVLRPKVPTERMVARLIRTLAQRFALNPPSDRTRAQTERSASSSAGKGSSASKRGTTSSPAHAT